MYPVRILGIAPYPGMERIMQQLAAQRTDIQLTTTVGNLSNWRQALNIFPAASYDVIISRGGTARMLAASVRVPVVEISTSVYDMLCSIRNAQGYAGKIAVVAHSNITERAKQLAEILQYDIVICQIDDHTDLHRELLRLKQEGCNLILGDYVSQHCAEGLGLNSMLIVSSEQSVQDAFDEAIRLVRAQNNFVSQNELYRQILQREWDELIVFTADGQIRYSTYPEDKDTSSFYDMLRQRLPALDDLPTEAECEWNGQFWRVSGQLVQVQQEPLIALRLKKNRFSFFSSGQGITLSSHADLPPVETFSTPAPIYVGAVSEVLESYATSPFPVLLLGEAGTGKDRAATQLYRSGPNRQNALITVDCQVICKKQWKQLLESEDSPLLRTGLTFYFKNLQSLSTEQAEGLFHFIEDSYAFRRNRMLFSSQGDGNDYTCSYLKSHFSSLVLHLPPLRERREDIPSLLALYINQLNALLGKQVVGFTDDALELIRSFSWEGNLSQLERVIRALVTQTDLPYIDREHTAKILREESPCTHAAPSQSGYYPINLKQSLADIEYDAIRIVLQEENNNQSQTARRLKIGRSTLWNLLRKRQV